MNEPKASTGAADSRLPRPKCAPHRILVVDDDFSIREVSKTVLNRSGYEVDTAVDGRGAWQALSTVSYDLLITDNSMPNVSGVELLKKVRDARMALPVIMATAQSPEEDFIQYPAIRPAATLLKPFNIAELLGTVKAVLGMTAGAGER
jgi:DNA-binding response OmpR family regulator